MLNPLESTIFEALAYDVNHDSTEVPRLLISPRNDKLIEYTPSSLARKAFGRVSKLVLDDKRITLLGIVSGIDVTPDELNYLMALWTKGKNEQKPDVQSVIDTLRNNYLISQSEVIMDDCRHSNKASPAEARHNIDVTSSRLATLSNGGLEYDPRPMAHFDDKEFEASGTFGDPIIDDFFATRKNPHGGIMNYSTILWVAPTKQGKSTMMMTLAARAILGGREVTYISNELSAGIISNNILDAIDSMYGSEQDRPDREGIKRIINDKMVVYENMRGFEDTERRMYWHHSPVTIIDSLDHLGYPATSDKFYKAEDKHNDRASTILELSRKYNMMLHIPANASESNQKQLRKDITDVDSVMAFGSALYQNTFDMSFGIARNRSVDYRAIVKLMVSRVTSERGSVWDLSYDPQGRCYYGIARRQA